MVLTKPPQDATWPDGRPVTPWADPWHDVMADLRAAGQFVRPLAPEEIGRRAQLHRESGHLTRDQLILAMLELDAGWY